jgi:hypothetical protein
MRARRCFAVCVLLLAISGCKSPTSPTESPLAPSSVMIDGATVTLETVGYRNFQPSPQPNQSLALVMRLRTTSAAVRNGLTVTSVSATSNASGEHWTSSAIQRSVAPDEGADYVQFAAGDGPPWPVGSTCTVTVSVRSANGTVATLGNAGVVITSVS